MGKIQARIWVLTTGLLAGALLASIPAQAANRAADLASSFQAPPASARPHAYWYWVDGLISAEGIDADLEAMRRAGIGGVELYSIGGHGPQGPVKVLSPAWYALMKQAITKASALGIEVDLNNSPGGWSSSGGPWITPELSMQKVTWSETRLTGGQPFSGTLAQPETREDFYRDIAVLAFPTPAAERQALPLPDVTGDGLTGKAALLFDGQPVPAVTLPAPAAGAKQRLTLDYRQPISARSLRIIASSTMVPPGRLTASDDAQHWRPVLAFDTKGRVRAPVDAVFAPVCARYWRLEFDGQEALRLAEVLLSPRYRLPAWTGKAMFDEYGIDKPPCTPPDLAAPADCVIPPDAVVDLSARMDVTGRLTWEAPPGDWTVLRFGHTSTGVANLGGYECDKFDAAAFDVHWNHFAGPMLADPQIGPHIQYLHIDSYEKGAQNWTKNFPAAFRQRRGYDLRPFLPALTGRVLGDTLLTERFLWDFRQVCCGLMAENYFGRMGELCRQAGKRFTCEPYHQTQFDNVTVGGKADVPMCEFWTGGQTPAYWFKLGASPAHLYGKPVVGAEAFTAVRRKGGDYAYDLWDIKAMGDAAFCGGVNRYVFHVFVHQPWLDKAPGVTLAAFGTHFERSNTWFEQMPAYTRYVARCQHLLQQGQFLADVLYACGENEPSTGLWPLGDRALPRGYDYDVSDAATLLNRVTVREGALHVDGGMVYRLLVLPEDASMTPAMLRRLRTLVQDGATVLGPRPQRSPSLTDQPAADAEVRQLAAEVWGDCDGVQRTDHRFGKGRIIWGQTVREALTALQVREDFDTGPVKGPVNFIHRRLDDGTQLYFVANLGDKTLTVDGSFRIAGRAPELWDPLTGSIRALPVYREVDGRTVIPMRFAPRQSFFVMFKENAPAPGALQRAARNFPDLSPVLDLSGAWQVRFDPKWGGPEAPVTLERLEDWTRRPEQGIRYFSGTATYRKVFDLPAQALAAGLQPAWYLDLGVVKNIAHVRLNGRDLGTVWCAPWQVNISGAVKPGANELEIDVVNLWPNRLIGDEQFPDDCEWSPSGHGGMQLKRLPRWLLEHQPRPSSRYSFSTWKHWTKDDPLLPSGLLGPVQVLREQ